MSDTDGEYSQEVCCNRKAETLHATPLSRLCLDRRLCEPWLPKECRSGRILIDLFSAPKEILHRNTGYPTSVPISRMNDIAGNLRTPKSMVVLVRPVSGMRCMP